eukprot:CAMPEP_0194063622 /NCGR_PEP_ID=MMETSP0009_2-20130614/80854_1 /TAXON_ID=210454 /ORGANISM="Grammatophora oceanica, Strain CCMP 410" /LENGTH=108 /DNA_ID=CAMNT_0038715821 /DNA_START=47 /DNA_END=371 /DNA_ORIENTATION=-
MATLKYLGTTCAKGPAAPVTRAPRVATASSTASQPLPKTPTLARDVASSFDAINAICRVTVGGVPAVCCVDDETECLAAVQVATSGATPGLCQRRVRQATSQVEVHHE